MSSPSFIRFLLILFCVSGAPFMNAQTAADKGSIGGAVTDDAGAPIPDARVVATNDATGVSRETSTGSSGLYEFTALDPGTYSVNVEARGVGALIKVISVRVGGTLRVNVTLSINSSVESINVAASTVATTEPTASELLDEGAIDHLPIDGRRFQDFAVLAPGVEAFTQTLNQLSFSGQRGIYSNVMVDGSDYNEPYLGGIRGGDRSSSAFTIPLSAIQEFQAVESGYASEYGRSTGGVLNVLTRSGANQSRGTAFYQIRVHGLSSGDPYGLASIGNQHQFGGSYGGPILRSKLFYFVAAEGQRAAFPQNVRFPALDALAGNVTPDIAPAYNYLRSLEKPFNQTNNIAALFGRVDYQFGGNHLAARYNYSQNRARNGILPGFAPQSEVNQALSSNGQDLDYTGTASVQLTSTLPFGVNDLRVGYSHERHPQTSNSASPYVVAGTIGNFGDNPQVPSDLSDYRAQISDAVSVVKGRHSFSMGGDYSYISASSRTGANQYGSFVIDSSDTRQILETLSGTSVNRFDDPSVSYLIQVGNTYLGAHAQQSAVFGQDNWRITPALTLNFGLRWEGQMNPHPALDNSFLLDNVRNYPFPLGRVDPSVIRSQFDQWAPRASFAWDPNGRGTTTVRGSAGIFYGQTPLLLYAGPINNFSSTPSDLSLQIAPSSAGTVYQQFLAGGYNLSAGSVSSLPVFSVPDVWINVAGKPNPFSQANVITTSGNNFRNPRSAQLSLVVQHQMNNKLFLDYQVNHMVTVHLERNVDYNVPRASVRPGDLSLRPYFGLEDGVSRANPNLGSVLVRDSSAHSNYLANTFRVRYRLGNLQLAAHYTLSYNKSDDDNERQNNVIAYQNPFNFSRDYNWSALDSRHEVAGYVVWQARWHFELSTLFEYHSGLPIDATTGSDTSGLLTSNWGNRPLIAPGLYMLRDSFRNRDFKTIDLRIAKTLQFREHTNLQLYGELFNLMNFSNVAFVPANVYPNNPAFIYGTGIIMNGTQAPVNPGFLKLRTASGGFSPVSTYQQGTPFEAQLGLRVNF